MSNLGLQFVISAKRVKLVDAEPERTVQNTILIFCEGCMELMPHYVRDGYRECSCCFNRVYPQTEEQNG